MNLRSTQLEGKSFLLLQDPHIAQAITQQDFIALRWGAQCERLSPSQRAMSSETAQTGNGKSLALPRPGQQSSGTTNIPKPAL